MEMMTSKEFESFLKPKAMQDSVPVPEQIENSQIEGEKISSTNPVCKPKDFKKAKPTKRKAKAPQIAKNKSEDTQTELTANSATWRRSVKARRKQTTADSEDLDSDVMESESLEKKIYSCKFCNYKTSSSQALGGHAMKNHKGLGAYSKTMETWKRREKDRWILREAQERYRRLVNKPDLLNWDIPRTDLNKLKIQVREEFMSTDK